MRWGEQLIAQTRNTRAAQPLIPLFVAPQLWDVVDDQDAVDLVANVEDPQEASEMLLQHALR